MRLLQPIWCFLAWKPLEVTTASRYIGVSSHTSSMYMECALKMKAHTPWMTLLRKKAYHQWSAVMTQKCNNGELAGCNGCMIGCAKLSLPSQITPNKTLLKCVQYDGSRRTTMSFEKEQGYQSSHGYWCASTLPMSITSQQTKCLTGRHLGTSDGWRHQISTFSSNFGNGSITWTMTINSPPLNNMQHQSGRLHGEEIIFYARNIWLTM